MNKCNDVALTHIDKAYSRYQEWQLANHCQGTFPDRTAFSDKHGPHTDCRWYQTPPEISQPLSGMFPKIPCHSSHDSGQSGPHQLVLFPSSVPSRTRGGSAGWGNWKRVCKANWKPGHLIRRRLTPPFPSQGEALFYQCENLKPWFSPVV